MSDTIDYLSIYLKGIWYQAKSFVKIARHEYNLSNMGMFIPDVTFTKHTCAVYLGE